MPFETPPVPPADGPDLERRAVTRRHARALQTAQGPGGGIHARARLPETGQRRAGRSHARHVRRRHRRPGCRRSARQSATATAATTSASPRRRPARRRRRRRKCSSTSPTTFTCGSNTSRLPPSTSVTSGSSPTASSGRPRSGGWASATATLKRTVGGAFGLQQLVVAFQEGEFVGPASFRLATIDYEAKDYKTALPLFPDAPASLAKGDDVRLTSRYFEAICLEQLGRRDETREVYEDVLAVTERQPVPRRRPPRAGATGRQPEASQRGVQAIRGALARGDASPRLQAEAALKAGSARARPRTERHRRWRCSSAPRNCPARARMRARGRDDRAAPPPVRHEQVQAAARSLSPPCGPRLPAALQPEAMLLAANAQRQLGKHAEARDALRRNHHPVPAFAAGPRGALPAHHQPVRVGRPELRQGGRRFPRPPTPTRSRAIRCG